MSRLTKPAPLGSHLERVEGGYKICARCGAILCNGENVEVVYGGDRGTWRGINTLGPDWFGIYTHPEGPSCGYGTASGWSAIERAIDRREFNQPTPRESQAIVLLGYTFPFVSLLDNRQLDLECKAVESYEEEYPESQVGRTWSEQCEADDEKPFLIEYDIKFAHRGARVSENAYIRLLDRCVLGRWAVLNRRVTEKARERLFVTRPRQWLEHSRPFEFYFPGKSSQRYVGEDRLGSVTDPLVSEKWASILQGMTQGSALSQDNNGEAVEYALYSRWSVVSTEKGRELAYPLPPAKVPTDLDFWAERDALIRIARRSGVTERKIVKALQFSSNLSLAQEIGKKDNEGKTLKLGELDELGVCRLAPRANHVPLSFDSRQFPERYHWKVPPTDFRCPHCNMSFDLASEYCSDCGERITLEERVKAVIDSAVRDLATDPTALYEPCATLKVNFLNALNKNLLPDSQNFGTTQRPISTPAKDPASYRGDLESGSPRVTPRPFSSTR